jgi:prepilin-type N-terminal cleavage/methylation domain-containing protein
MEVERTMTSLQFEFRSPRKDEILRHKMRGFSLLEMMIVVAIGMILTGITFISLKPLLNQARVNAGYDTTLMALRTYRSRAITERRRYIVAFTAPRTITISSWGVGSPIAPAPVLVSTLTLPTDIQFMVQGGMPSTAPTVPDGFGVGAIPIDFGQGLGVGSLNYVMFMPDGTSQDQSNPSGGNGNPNSGVIYLGKPTELLSMRAVSVFGATGRIRGWRLLNQGGGPQWSQQ